MQWSATATKSAGMSATERMCVPTASTTAASTSACRVRDGLASAAAVAHSASVTVG